MGKFQAKLRESGVNLGLLTFKIFTGFMVGLTLALIFRELGMVGNIGFTAVIVLTIGTFFKIARKWEFTGVFIFNLFCVMTALLLRMYILVAPGE